ncbi:MAG: 16S rRNA (guanine(966)-N(2))-methyltransferase RsmD [Lachnospiraceae bacterium]|jgi:16S rRNA (guanine966-N2)-methyltransferase|nr:16S rRNA (guanine(966)-N(2))-methyltransferase RsmD [Lachnospiraceae bacterium]
MRVIAGTARSLPLKTSEGKDTRPTTDRIKETLFNMLQSHIPGCVFVDLFSGSGGIGIEALSRGAKSAYFVESDRNATKNIRDNLAFTRLADRAVVLQEDARRAFYKIKEVPDIVFMDPPYNSGLEQEILEVLAKSGQITEETMIVVEASLKTDFSYVERWGFQIIKEKCYKTNKHMFMRRNTQDEDSDLSGQF